MDDMRRRRIPVRNQPLDYTVGDLIRRLGGPSSDAAVAQLVAIGAPAVEALCEALEFQNYGIRSAVMGALTAIGLAAVGRLRATQTSERRCPRRCRHRARGDRRLLVTTIWAPHSPIRSATSALRPASALFRMGMHEAVGALHAAREDPDDCVRFAVRTALTDAQGEPAVEPTCLRSTSRV